MDPGNVRTHRTDSVRRSPPRASALASLALVPYLSADALARVLPRPALESLARAVARIAFELRLPARRRLEANLELVRAFDRVASHGATCGADREARAAVRHSARDTFEHFALAFADFLTLGRMGRDALESAIVVRGEHHYRAARDSGRGVIVMSAHAGNWELGAAFLAARGSRVHMVARRHASERVESFFARRRAAWGVSRLCGRPLWLSASAALRRKEWVAMMGDRPSPGSNGSLCAWAAALARRTGAIVLPATMTRLPDGRYLASFDAPIDAAACAEGRWRSTMISHLRSAPGQWFAFETLPEAFVGPA